MEAALLKNSEFNGEQHSNVVDLEQIKQGAELIGGLFTNIKAKNTAKKDAVIERKNAAEARIQAAENKIISIKNKGKQLIQDHKLLVFGSIGALVLIAGGIAVWYFKIKKTGE